MLKSLQFSVVTDFQSYSFAVGEDTRDDLIFLKFIKIGCMY